MKTLGINLPKDQGLYSENWKILPRESKEDGNKRRYALVIGQKSHY